MPATTRRSSPADRLLETATALFDREGIRAVGIDRLIADAEVARASLYQHFGSKDSLVVSYLRRADEGDRAGYHRAARGLDEQPLRRILLMFDRARTGARRRDYRGCLYVNALTEFPEPTSPVRAVVTAHRQWQLTELRTALAQLGVPEPDGLAARLQLLYDGALVGSKAAHSVEPIAQAGRLAEELIAAALPN